MLTRNAKRAGATSAGAALMLLLMTSNAFANTRVSGDDPGQGLSAAQTLGLYVGIPLVAFIVIAGLVMLLDRSTIRNRKNG